ncbi:MAG: DMT family transporter [Ardenticatenaceae bacterium]|nr:DMT family transporter [Ardenticatenaceae bacterium]
MTSTITQPNTHWHGIRLVMMGVFLFSLQDLVIKQVSSGYPVHQIVFIRSGVALLLLLLLAWLRGEWRLLYTRRLSYHIVRGFMMLISYTTYYLAIAALPLAETVALYFVSPLLVTLLSVLWLKERISWAHWVTLGVGFVGTVVMLRPGLGVFEIAALLPIVAALAYAVSVILARQMADTENGMGLAVYATAVYFIVSGIIGLVLNSSQLATGTHPSLQFLTRPWLLPTPLDMALMSITGLIAAIGFYGLSEAYRVAPATIVAPFEYIMLPLSVLWGFLFWRELPDWLTFVGAALVIGSGLKLLPRRPQRRRWLLRRM